VSGHGPMAAPSGKRNDDVPMTKTEANPSSESRSAPLFHQLLIVICYLLRFSVPAFLVVEATAASTVVFEQTSPYHHIRVVDDGGVRTLFFDDAPQSSMGLTSNLTGHFEYVEYFHMPWLWNTQITNVLM